MFEFDLAEQDPGCLHRLDGGIERAGVPGHCDWNVAQIGKCLHTRIPSHHDRASAYGGVEPDDLASAQLLHALDSAPLAHRIDFKRTLLELRLLPTVGEVLDPAFITLGIVLMVGDVEPFLGKEALLHCNPPGSVVGVTVALEPC